MNDFHLKILNLLIREPNLSTVAEKSGTTQSNLSKILKRMELDWGVKLFDRKGFRGLRPTPEALRLAQIGEQLTHEWNLSLNLIKNKNYVRPDLRVIGPLVWTQNFFLPYWYQSNWAETNRLVMTIAPLAELNLKTVGANFDIVISSRQSYLENYVAKKLFKERFVLIFNRQKAPESLEKLDFSKYNWLAYRAENDPMHEFFRIHQVSTDLVHSYVNDLTSLVNLVKMNSRFVACVPDHLYEIHKSGLVGFEVDLRSGSDLFFFRKHDNDLSRKVFEELRLWVKK